jgi:transposase-like protein
MARKKLMEERVRELVTAVLAEEEEEGGANRNETIDDIENAMVRFGDMVAREFGVQKLARHTGRGAEDEQCPCCGHAGVRVGERSRTVITRRGEVPVTEAKYRCPKCRRHFFPSNDQARA